MNDVTRRYLLFVVAALIAVILTWLSVYFSDGIKPFATLGKPGTINAHYELGELPIDIVFDEKHNRIISRQEDGKIVSWNVETGTSAELGKTSAAFDYCADKTLLLSSHGNKSVHVHNLTDGTIAAFAEETYDHAAWTPDCSKLALADATGRRVELWDSAGQIMIASAGTSMDVRNGLAVSVDGRFIAAAEGTHDEVLGHDTLLEIFALSDGGTLAPAVLIDQQDTILGVWKMVFSPEQDRLFVGSQIDGKSGLEAFSAASGAQLWSREGFASYWVRAIAVSPDGSLLATGDENGRLGIWNAATGRLRAEVNTGQVVQSASFSQSGKTLAISQKDSTIALYDVTTLLKQQER